MRSNHQLLGLLRSTHGTVYLRSELQRLLGCQDIDHAVTPLLQRGYLQQINEETFLFRRAPKTALSFKFRRLPKQMSICSKHHPNRRTTAIARFVCELAKSNRVSFQRTQLDQWAEAATRLSGDEIESDSTDNLLVALTRAGKLSARDMTRLVAAHHRELKRV